MYEYRVKTHEAREEYVPFSIEEVAAKFAYFRETEASINGGPWPEICGTDRGYYRHIRRKEPRCEPCKAAHSRSERHREKEAA